MLNRSQDDIMKNWGNEKSPIISIKCLAYNHEKYIAQALDGFLMQKTSFPFEVIVHDDASTDNTANIIREYENKYPQIIKPIYQIENQYSKPGVSVNDFIYPRLKGKYVALCEGDDYWTDENKLQMQVCFLENNPEYTMCFHNAIKYDCINKKEYMFNDTSFLTLGLKNLILEWHIPTASMVYRKSVLQNKMPGKSSYPQGDILIHFACYDSGKVFYFPQCMSVYRYNVLGSSTARSNSDPFKYLYGNILLWEDLNIFYNYKYSRYIKKKIRYNRIQIFKQNCLKNSKFLRVVKKIYRKISDK